MAPTRQTKRATTTLLFFVCAVLLLPATVAKKTRKSQDADSLLVVDCLLPGQIRKLGRRGVYSTPRQPVKTTAVDCEIRGGEYVSHDRADYTTALKIWLPAAKDGDATAQNYVGEIFEKGRGVAPDYALAARWYRLAAEQGDTRAQLNLGQLYERGLGVSQDSAEAVRWYRRASGFEGLGLDFLPVAAPAKPVTPESKPAAVAKPVELAGPTIQVIEPAVPQTRGFRTVAASAAVGQRLIIGRVDAPAGLMGLTVNEREETAATNGMFRTRINVVKGGTPVAIVAIDQQGKRAERRFVLQPTPPRDTPTPTPRQRPRIDFGKFVALVIGNNNYAHLPNLSTAIADAKAVSQLLAQRYGFRVTLLLDADRYDILSSLNELRASLTQKDNLLIYYAGHGQLDEANMRGNWLPVDAEPTSTANWISNVAVTDILNAMAARHVIVVADSCYSGALTRSALTRLDAGLTVEERETWIRNMTSKRSRTALTSGGLKPVLDRGGRGHSVFAHVFIEALKHNKDVLEGERLYREVSGRVSLAAERIDFEQVPQYDPIRHAGHEAGEFFFVPES